MRGLDCDVIVVGAGPAGSFVSQRLAEEGVEVTLLDENAEPRSSIICSGIVSLEAFEQFDLPRESILDTIPKAIFHSPAGTRVDYRPRQPLAHVVDRTRFDGGLTKAAEAAGARVLRSHEVREIRPLSSAVEVEALHLGQARRLRARAAVVATGYRAGLHKQAGLGRPRGYVQGVHIEMPMDEVDAAELYFGRSVAPGLFAWAVPRGPGLARLGLMVPQYGRRYLDAFLAFDPIRSRLRKANGNGRPAGNGFGHVLSRGIVQGGIWPSFGDRVLAVGEAAGQTKTTTGGGIYYGLIGANLAAGVLKDGLRRNRLDAAALRRYETAWHNRLGREIEMGLELQEVGAAMEDAQIDDLFESMNGGLAAMLWPLIEFDWHSSALQSLFRDRRFRMLVVRRLMNRAVAG